MHISWLGLHEDAYRFFYYIPLLFENLIFSLKSPYFFFKFHLMAWKCLLSMISKCFTPFT